MKFQVPIILFLDRDPERSAMALTNQFLERCTRTSCQVLMCTAFYLVGIRSKRHFAHYVSKERWEDTKWRLLSHYPLDRKPEFTFYTSQESRWCRKCADHYRLVLAHFSAMLSEYTFRTGKVHPLEPMDDFFRRLPMDLGIKKGTLMPSLKDPSKLVLPWKSLPLKYRKRDVIAGYRAYYSSLIPSPLDAFLGTKRDVPDFLVGKMDPLA